MIRICFRHLGGRVTCLLLLALLSLTSHAQDIALLRLLTPQSGCELGSQTVSVQAYNYGALLGAGTQFLGLYVLDGGSSQNQAFTLDTPWEPMTARVLTFTVPGNFAAPGNHSLMVSINMAGDPNNGNNTLHHEVIRTSAATVAGSLSHVPTGVSAGSLQLSGQVGSVVQWEQSPDGLRWFKLASNDATQAYANLDRPTQFRVRVANEACPASTSAALLVTP